jgi:hypothetical protein
MSRRKLLLGFIFALVLSFGAGTVLAATSTVTPPSQGHDLRRLRNECGEGFEVN